MAKVKMTPGLALNLQLLNESDRERWTERFRVAAVSAWVARERHGISKSVKLVDDESDPCYRLFENAYVARGMSETVAHAAYITSDEEGMVDPERARVVMRRFNEAIEKV